MFSPLNFHNVAIGPELVRTGLYICFGPITADILGGTFVYMCACDMEHVKRNKEDSDENYARMGFGVYRTNAATKDLAEILHDLKCDRCNQNVTN